MGAGALGINYTPPAPVVNFIVDAHTLLDSVVIEFRSCCSVFILLKLWKAFQGRDHCAHGEVLVTD